MIVKRKTGYFVLSERTKRNLGGPYKTRAEAVKRLQQVEYFKRLKGCLTPISSRVNPRHSRD